MTCIMYRCPCLKLQDYVASIHKRTRPQLSRRQNTGPRRQNTGPRRQNTGPRPAYQHCGRQLTPYGSISSCDLVAS
ncbi:hypothetical protein BD626DRAFT_520803 [Schizophyllum amplum]|uniref:Uncharacterized protein n=1 Tax=Schizophyllum amplum TaxID=97359 RepID=A0A550BU80_9AGAR|nr:hypothetical protein BD626DRAFT_520803 [Auriculariopsis ampla]